MIFENMINRYNILTYFQNKFIQRGYNFKQISFINAQIMLLNKFIKIEGYNVLNIILREKTNYRFLKQVEKGLDNIIEISKYPEKWKLCKVEDCIEEWLNPESLIFSTEKETLVFTKNNKWQGQNYINNKWQWVVR